LEKRGYSKNSRGMKRQTKKGEGGGLEKKDVEEVEIKNRVMKLIANDGKRLLVLARKGGKTLGESAQGG